MQHPRIIDGDGHIQEDNAGIANYLPNGYREMVMGAGGIFPPLDHLHTALHSFSALTPAERAARGRVGPDEWVAFLDDVGIETTVLYPTSALAYGRIPYPEVAVATTRAYNDWLYETYTKRNPRFKGVGLVPLQDPEAAVDELRHVVEDLGFCGAMLPSNGLKGNLGSKEYWPVYEQAQKYQCCLSIHGGVHEDFGIDHLDVWTYVHALGHPWGLMIALAGIVSNRILDRYPDVRLGFLEGGVSWLLTCLERFDSSCGSYVLNNPTGRILEPQNGQKISSYLLDHIKAGQIFIGCEGDELGLSTLVRMVGSEPFLYSSDFPHEVSNESCKHEIEELLENKELSQADKEAILHGNAERFYRLNASELRPAGLRTA